MFVVLVCVSDQVVSRAVVSLSQVVEFAWRRGGFTGREERQALVGSERLGRRD